MTQLYHIELPYVSKLRVVFPLKNNFFPISRGFDIAALKLRAVDAL